MIRSRCRSPAPTPPDDTIKPPFGERRNSVMPRSSSAPSGRSIGLTSTPSNGPTAWMAPSCPLPEARLGSRMTAARVTCGAISLSSCSHLPLMPYSSEVKPVALPPGQAGDKAAADRIGDLREHDRYAACGLQQRSHRTGAIGDDEVGHERDHFRHVLAHAFGTLGSQPIVDANVAADGPAQLLQALQQCREAGLPFRIVRGERREHPDAPHSLAVLRLRRDRPRCRAAEQRDELAPPHHSITSSARASSVSGTVRPSALAVLRLITSSYLVGACTGRSAGFSPLRMRST